MCNFNFNFTLSFLCTREQNDRLDTRNKYYQKQTEFIIFIVSNPKHYDILTWKKKGN